MALPPLEVLESEVRLPALHPVMQGFGPPLYGILLLQRTARFCTVSCPYLRVVHWGYENTR